MTPIIYSALSGSSADDEDALDLIKIYPPPDAAHKDCLICEGHFPSEKTQQQYRDPDKMKFGATRAQTHLSALLRRTKDNIQHVKEMLHSHGDLILARWKKYSPKRRAELLTKASPSVFIRCDLLGRLDPSQDCANTYISWLNTNHFSEDRMRLMSFLHARSEYGPEQWAAFDTRSAWLCCQKGRWERCVYNANAVVMHGEHYGKLVPFAVSSAHSWQEVGYPRAELTFLVQESISAALSAVVDLIVNGETPGGNAKWTTFLSKGLRSAYEEALWSSYYHQEFTPPSTFDPEVISEKANNHLNILMDEIELVQTDPKHMRQYTMELKTDTFVWEGERKLSGEWTKATQVITFMRMSDLMRWRQVVGEADKLKNALVESKRASGACFNKDADTAVKNFGKVISDMLKTLVEEGPCMLQTVTVMRSLWVREEKCQKSFPLGHISGICTCADNHDRCDRILSTAMKTEGALVNECPDGISWLLLKLRDDMQGITYNKDVENWLSGMALLDEIHTLWRWRQTSCHRDVEAVETPISTSLKKSLEDIRSWQLQRIVDLGKLQECSELLRTFCETFPKTTLRGSSPKQMIKAHDHLTKFWVSARKSWSISQMENSNSIVSKEDMLSLMSFDVSPEHLDKIEAMRLRSESEGSQVTTRKDETSITPFVQQPWDVFSGDDGAVRRNLPKKSNASRNDASVEDRLQMMELDQELVDDADTAAGRGSDPMPQIAVKKETLDLMAQLFPVGAINDTGTVRWTQFVRALADAGMTATQSAGSAVTFRVHDQSITLHQPHPEPEIDAIKLRKFDKSLSKKYGWTNETFVLRQKVSAEVQEEPVTESGG